MRDGLLLMILLSIAPSVYLFLFFRKDHVMCNRLLQDARR